MSKKPSGSRITIALEAQTHAHSLEAMAKLAASLEAELLGVFIEDTDILQAARLPFALEVCRATNIVRSVDSEELERELKMHAERARNLIAELAVRSGARWSFEVVRQRTASAVLELAQETDVTMYAAAAAYRYSAARTAATSIAIGHQSADSIVALIDRSAASNRVMQIAHRLAKIHGVPIHAVTIAASRAGLARLAERLHRSELGTAPIHGLCRPEFDDITTEVRSRSPATVVLPISLVKGSAERVQKLREAVDHPVVIVQ